MPGSRRAWTPAAGLIAVGYLAAFPARALADAPRVEPIAVTYAADDGTCPTEERFVDRVRSYTVRWTQTEPNGDVRKFHVRLAPRGNEFVGTLAITPPGGKTTTREIVAPECEALARALAIVVALAIDPAAHIAEPTVEPDAERSPPPPAESAPPPSEEPAAVPERPNVPQPPNKFQPHGPRLQFSLEARAELTSAVTSSVLPVFGAAAEMRVLFGPSVPSWLSPALALGLRQSLPNEVSLPGGASEFLWTAGTIRLCPVRLVGFSARFEAVYCAEVDLGTLRAEARGVPAPRRTTTAWLDRGLSLRSMARLDESWAVGASVLVAVPMTRHRFALASGESISQAPTVGVTGGLLLELRL